MRRNQNMLVFSSRDGHGEGREVVLLHRGTSISVTWLWGVGSVLACAGWNGQKTMCRVCCKEKLVLVLLKWLLSHGSPLGLLILQRREGTKWVHARHRVQTPKALSMQLLPDEYGCAMFVPAMRYLHPIGSGASMVVSCCGNRCCLWADSLLSILILSVSVMLTLLLSPGQPIHCTDLTPLLPQGVPGEHHHGRALRQPLCACPEHPQRRAAPQGDGDRGASSVQRRRPAALQPQLWGQQHVRVQRGLSATRAGTVLRKEPPSLFLGGVVGFWGTRSWPRPRKTAVGAKGCWMCPMHGAVQGPHQADPHPCCHSTHLFQCGEQSQWV